MRLRSDIAWSTRERISIHGHDLTRDLLGKVDLGAMAFLELTGRLPSAREARMFNALAVTLVEHGIVPSTLATRLTYYGAPESLQGAVASGLLGLGTVVVGSIEGAARMLQQALPDPRAKVDLRALARSLVDEHRQSRSFVSGLGHPLHKPVDPRAVRLFALARANGFSGPYVRLMQHIQVNAEKVYARPLPINATGAIGAICSEMGLPWQICRGIGVMARAVGLVGHVLEELRQPMAEEVWLRADEEATAHARGRSEPRPKRR